LLCPSWVDCIIATRGYDFRKGHPIADLKMGRLVQAWATISDPVGNPVDHLRELYGRTAKETDGLGCIGQQCRWRFLADDLRLLSTYQPSIVQACLKGSASQRSSVVGIGACCRIRPQCARSTADQATTQTLIHSFNERRIVVRRS
jgi:hypothetical protein